MEPSVHSGRFSNLAIDPTAKILYNINNNVCLSQRKGGTEQWKISGFPPDGLRWRRAATDVVIPDAEHTCWDGCQMTGEALMSYGLSVSLEDDCASVMKRWYIQEPTRSLARSCEGAGVCHLFRKE